MTKAEQRFYIGILISCSVFLSYEDGLFIGAGAGLFGLLALYMCSRIDA